ncbi:MAG TPA: flippase, partial [Erwinia persicina]|nr:flippase [Erwinia persicina]HBT55473.1 flippase [Erwinia persicina]
LLLGPAFHASADVLRIAVCGFIFGNISYPAGLQILIPHGLAKQRMYLMFIVGAANIPFCCLMAWKFGALGAACALVFSEVLVFIGIIYLLVKHNILKTYLARPAAYQRPGNEQA